MALLEMEQVTVSFGGNRALDEISMHVEAGKLTGLIGPNGAGKTTMFNVVTGLLPPSNGRIVLDGRDISRLAPHKRAQLGMARTFQRLELFTSLSVRDNIRVAGEIRNHWGVSARAARRGLNESSESMDAAAEADRIVELVGLGSVVDREVSEIPTGQARVVELGRALMTKPRVLLLDEPASGQTEQETRAFGALLRELIKDGLAICLVEHDMSLVMEVCDVIHVLDYGRMIAVGTPEEIRSNQAVVDAYLGAPAGL